MADWQPIETAPKDGTEILLYCSTSLAAPSRWMEVGAWEAGEGWCGDGTLGLPATHWMTLPDPPEGPLCPTCHRPIERGQTIVVTRKGKYHSGCFDSRSTDSGA